MRSIIVLAAALSLTVTGCGGRATKVNYLITSTPPGGTVRVNGQERGTTPATVQLDSAEKYNWVDATHTGTRWEIDVTPVTISVAPPAGGGPGVSERTKRVTPSTNGGTLKFDLRDRP